MPEVVSRSFGRAPVPTGPKAWIGQLLLYGLFAAAIGVFSQWPAYRHLAPDQALVKVSFTRVGKPVGECRRLTEAELAKLPPNMRSPTVCPRERSPILVQVDLDGRRILERKAEPGGMSKDGASSIYERVVVPAGEHRIAVRISDDVRNRDKPFVRDTEMKLVPGQVLVVDFDPDRGGVSLQ